MNIVTPQNIDINKLSSLGIYELRNIARAIGVPRPTTLVKRELIKSITDVIQGTPSAERSIRGRPPRDLTFDITRVLDNETSVFSVFDVSDEPPCVRSKASSEVRTVSGFFHMVPRGHGTLISSDLFTYFVSLKLLTSFKLATGDFLEAKAIYNPARGTYTIEEITQINDIPSTKYANAPTVRYDSMKYIRPSKIKKLGDHEIKFGSRILISAPKDFPRLDEICELSKKTDGCYKIALIIEDSDDCVNFLLENKVDEVFLAKPEHNYKKHVLLCLTALFIAKRRAEAGDNVILFVDNLTKLFKVYNNSTLTDGQVSVSRINLGSITDAKIFFMSAHALEQGGSVTVIGYANNSSDQTDAFVLNEFSDIANVIINK